MGVLAIKSFGGIAPKVPPRYLQENQAQVAVNCPMFRGSLQPLKGLGPSLLTLPKQGPIKTIYRFGQDIISDTQFWFHWDFDVDVIRGQIPTDTSEWTFYTGDGFPKATYSTLALTGGTAYPMAARPLGILPPPSPVIAIAGAIPPDPSILETRVYTYTNVSKEAGFEKESAPAPASLPVDVSVGQDVELSGFAPVPAGYNVTHRRIYRSVSGVFLFVAEILSSASTFTDDVSAEDLAEELPSLTWQPPPEDLKGIINLPNGMAAGFVGRDVYFCESFRPYAWPEQYVLTVDYPIVGLGRMDTTLVVLTTGVPYFIQGSAPDAMIVVKSDIEQACVSKRSIVSAGNAVIYASPDGLVMLSPSGSTLVTEQSFTRAQWLDNFAPNTIHAYQHDRKYIAFYDDGTKSGGFIFDMATGQIMTHDVYVNAAYTDLVRDKMFIANDSKQVRVWEDGTPLQYMWKSKLFGLPRDTFFSCAQVEAEAYPITANYYVEGVLKFTKIVVNREPFRLPVLVGKDWEVEVTGTGEVFSIVMAQSMAELADA